MGLRLLRCRVVVIALAMLGLAAVAPAPSAAQTDARLGCAYTIVPDRPGPVGHTNMLQVTVRDCAYQWNALDVKLRDGASSTFTEAPAGFACDDSGFDVVCGRPALSTAGADLGIRPQCPRSGRLRLTLLISDAAGTQRSGAPKSFRCTQPPVKVLEPPARQSKASALRRGVITRFSCRVSCSARVTLIADTATGEKVGTAVFRRARAGTSAPRVRIKPAYRRRYRRAAYVTVSVKITASTGEQVTLGHTVRLR